MFWISLKFQILKRLSYIADSNTSALRTGADDITNFFGLSKLQLCWRDLHLLNLKEFDLFQTTKLSQAMLNLILIPKTSCFRSKRNSFDLNKNISYTIFRYSGILIVVTGKI